MVRKYTILLKLGIDEEALDPMTAEDLLNEIRTRQGEVKATTLTLSWVDFRRLSQITENL